MAAQPNPPAAERLIQSPQAPQRRKIRMQPEYYIKRASGEFVPLVPIDELPVEFYGLPRSLSFVDNSRMIFLGIKGPRTGFFRVKQQKLTVVPARQVVNEGAPNSAQSSVATKQSHGPEAVPQAISTSNSSSPSSTTAAAAEAAVHHVQPRPTPVAPPPELCHNWIRGYCKFEPNCRRIHQMPETVEELRDIVLRKIPCGHFPNSLAKLSNMAPQAQTQTQTAVQSQQAAHPAEALLSHSPSTRENANYVADFPGYQHGRQPYGYHKVTHGTRQQAPSARIRVIEAQLRQKAVADKEAKRNANSKAELEKERRQKDATAKMKEEDEGKGMVNASGNQRAPRSHAVVGKQERVPTGHLVDVR